MADDEVEEYPQQEEAAIKLAAFKARRENAFSKLTATRDVSKKVGPNSISNFLARCEELAQLKDQFDKYQLAIIDMNGLVPPAERLSVDSVSVAFDEVYYDIKATERVMNSRMGVREQNPDANMKLPKILVPKWDGDLDSYTNFMALYNQVVHNGPYTGATKLTYLRSLLSGPPLKLIEGFQFTDNDYLLAYRQLQIRYASTRVLAVHYLNKMFDFAPLRGDGYTDLQAYLDVFDSNYSAYLNLDLENHHDFSMCHFALRQLSSNTRLLFERSLQDVDTLPTFDQLIRFVRDQCKLKELTRMDIKRNDYSSSTPTKGNTKISKPASPRISSHTFFTETASPSSDKSAPSSNPSASSSENPPVGVSPSSCCPCCKGTHHIYKCLQYKNMTVSERFDFIKNLKRCFKCLGSHARMHCKSIGRCGVSSCQSTNHHTTLHYERKPTAPEQIKAQEYPPSFEKPSTSHQSFFTTPALPDQDILLGTACGYIRDCNGVFQPIRIVIDSGSKVNLITSECVHNLGLKMIPKLTHLSGAMSQQLGTSPGVVNCEMTPKLDGNPSWTAQAIVVKKVCSNLPTIPVATQIVASLSKMPLADKKFGTPGKIDFLLGASLYPYILDGLYNVVHGQPSAIQTVFGWVVIGELPKVFSPSVDQCLSLFTLDEKLQDVLQSFWKSEEVQAAPQVDPEYAIAEQHFVKTHSRAPDGSYIVRLPFSQKIYPPFGNSQILAERRWFNIETKLRKNKELRDAYHDFMQKYLDLGHMEETSSPSMYVIPHFAILRDSSTSPIRVVFDGSCRDSSAVSLNDRLLSGPPLQKDITEVLTHFRLKPVAITTDIKMMYRKIWVHPDDHKFQTIVWRRSESEPLKNYVLKTVTYGLKPAPFLAQRVLRQLVSEDGHQYPLASQAVLEACFMDDICYSVEDVKTGHKLKDELQALLACAGFELRKWASNRSEILVNIPPDHRAKNTLSIRPPEDNCMHILGIEWDPVEDVFTYKISMPESANSKRNVLSQVATIFDPLGWIAPVVFWAKSFLQELWTRGMDWDTQLDPELSSRWAEFASQLPSLSKLKLPRLCVVPHSKIQIIGMCDASMLGYAAVVYLRCVSSNQVKISIIKAKTKVAPLKVQTVPRLELCGAVLLSKLMQSLQYLIKKLSISEVFLFSDSQVVLAWINTPPHLLKTFVANRVVSILDVTKASEWRHIPTHLNSADIASRGTTPSHIVGDNLWWSGPEFLYKPTFEWPPPFNSALLPQALPELKTPVDNAVLTITTAVSASKPSAFHVITMLENSSSLLKVQRVLAWVQRFLHNARSILDNRRRGPLQVLELRSALQCCIRATQQLYYKKEFHCLSKGRVVSRPLSSLSPFIDKDRILRVGGRLNHANLPHDVIHPIILPKQAPLSALLCDHYHKYLLHAGPTATLALIRRKFWIISLRSLVRSRIRRCLPCHKSQAQPNHPVMADLPPDRVTPSRPFLHSGVDMAGPLYIKSQIHASRSSRLGKAYICMFVCMSTKAVHIELTSDLSTESFKGALDRFVARRGLCLRIYSDRGGNFVGAASDQKEIAEFLKNSAPQITDFLSSKEIEYHFNPAKAPWMGGLWESAIKCAKRHLFKITANKSLTYEEMLTFLTRVEATLNSRPLCPCDDENTPYLSPGHFLVGGPLTCPVEYDFTQENENVLRRWALVQRASQEFWNRWSREYLNTLLQRKKWTSPRAPLIVGEPVFIRSEETRPLEWPLGRVKQLFVGSDGVARSAEVQTRLGNVVRPVANLVPLPPK